MLLLFASLAHLPWEPLVKRLHAESRATGNRYESPASLCLDDRFLWKPYQANLVKSFHHKIGNQTSWDAFSPCNVSDASNRRVHALALVANRRPYDLRTQRALLSEWLHYATRVVEHWNFLLSSAARKPDVRMYLDFALQAREVMRVLTDSWFSVEKTPLPTHAPGRRGNVKPLPVEGSTVVDILGRGYNFWEQASTYLRTPWPEGDAGVHENTTAQAENTALQEQLAQQLAACEAEAARVDQAIKRCMAEREALAKDDGPCHPYVTGENTSSALEEECEPSLCPDEHAVSFQTDYFEITLGDSDSSLDDCKETFNELWPSVREDREQYTSCCWNARDALEIKHPRRLLGFAWRALLFHHAAATDCGGDLRATLIDASVFSLDEPLDFTYFTNEDSWGYQNHGDDDHEEECCPQLDLLPGHGNIEQWLLFAMPSLQHAGLSEKQVRKVLPCLDSLRNSSTGSSQWIDFVRVHDPSDELDSHVSFREARPRWAKPYYDVRDYMLAAGSYDENETNFRGYLETAALDSVAIERFLKQLNPKEVFKDPLRKLRLQDLGFFREMDYSFMTHLPEEKRRAVEN